MSNNDDIREFLNSVTHTHEADQFAAALTVWAGVLWHFYGELLDQGFKKGEAMVLVRELFVTTLNKPGKE